MESMERCTGHCHITEIMLKIAIKSIDSCFSIFVVQIQSSCRRQNKCDSICLNFVSGRVQTFWGKGENAAFSPFPKIFSKGLFFKGH